MPQSLLSFPQADVAEAKPAVGRWPLALGGFAVCVIVWAAVFHTTVAGILNLWKFGTFSHGYIVLPVSLWLCWQRRKELAELQPSPAGLPVPLLIFLCFAWLIGAAA